MMLDRPLTPAPAPLDADVLAPPSKSVTHRALVAAALADGVSTIRNPLRATDTSVTRDCLAALGIGIDDLGDRWVVHGSGGAIPGGGKLWLEQSGTSFRFLTAVAAMGSAPSHLDGDETLRERPVRELTTALERLGARVRPAPRGAALPLSVGGDRPRGGAVRLASGRSSQFASALLLIGSRLPGGLDLVLEPPVVSLPYVELTADVLRRFGVRIRRRERLRWKLDPGGYAGRDFRVEGDHSSASYCLAAACVVGGRVRVRGVAPDSLQADARLGEILANLGCRVERGPDWVEVSGTGAIAGFDLDLSDAPDLVPTLAVLGLFASGPCALRGIGHLRYKESNRLELLARNLTSLGRASRATTDRLEIDPPAPLHGGRIETASDHRIAMAFAIAALKLQGVRLDDTSCVTKSDPGFWKRLESLAR